MKKTNTLLGKIALVTVLFLFSNFISLSFVSLSKADTGALFVNPATGSDANAGTTADVPLKSVQRALDIVQPGQTVNLASGNYSIKTGLANNALTTRRHATANARITVQGPADAVLRPEVGTSHILQVEHDYYTFQGFSIDGAGAGDSRLVYVQGREVRDGVNGLKLLKLDLKNSGGECVRLRYFAHDNEIAGNRIINCGTHKMKSKNPSCSGTCKNGEGIYIGTASPDYATSPQDNPTAEPDGSSSNYIHDNYIDTAGGNECVDIKEFAHDNTVAANTCRGQSDTESGGMESRGHNNTFKGNDIRGAAGAGIRLGADKDVAASTGGGNKATKNTLVGNRSGGIKYEQSGQGEQCGNILSGNTGGNAVGSYAKGIDPTKPCAPSISQSTSKPVAAIEAPKTQTIVRSCATDESNYVNGLTLTIVGTEGTELVGSLNLADEPSLETNCPSNLSPCFIVPAPLSLTQVNPQYAASDQTFFIGGASINVSPECPAGQLTFIEANTTDISRY